MLVSLNLYSYLYHLTKLYKPYLNRLLPIKNWLTNYITNSVCSISRLFYLMSVSNWLNSISNLNSTLNKVFCYSYFYTKLYWYSSVNTIFSYLYIFFLFKSSIRVECFCDYSDFKIFRSKLRSLKYISFLFSFLSFCYCNKRSIFSCSSFSESY